LFRNPTGLVPVRSEKLYNNKGNHHYQDNSFTFVHRPEIIVF